MYVVETRNIRTPLERRIGMQPDTWEQIGDSYTNKGEAESDMSEVCNAMTEPNGSCWWQYRVRFVSNAEVT